MIERRAIPHEEDETWRRAAQNIKSLRYKPLKNANSQPSLYNNTCFECEIINKRRSYPFIPGPDVSQMGSLCIQITQPTIQSRLSTHRASVIHVFTLELNALDLANFFLKEYLSSSLDIRLARITPRSAHTFHHSINSFSLKFFFARSARSIAWSIGAEVLNT